MRRVFAFLFALAFLGISASALADVPTEMSVQGRLTNAGGAPVPAGLKNFTFKIWDAAAGGTEIWPAGLGETQVLTTDANGLWNAGVGTVIPLTEAVFLAPVRWLEVTVDDGVNPIEILPRIELRTNPYTYRAATSQQADSLAGNSFGDIADMFVDETGDTMSGQLRIDWDHTTGSPNQEIENINNAYPTTWNDATGTWGASIDANSDALPYNVGLGGAAQGDNTNNYGVYGIARGAGSTNYGVRGTAAGGTSNYAGRFDGDVWVDNGNGNAGVLLPADAISASEILDEPGIAYDNSILDFSLAPSDFGTDIARVTLTMPAAGYVVVTATVVMRFSGTTAANYGWINLDTSGTDNSLFNSTWYWAGAEAHSTSSSDYQTVTATRVFNLPAGARSFEVIGNAFTLNAALASQSIWSANILATYIPTSYGGVDALVADASGFEHSNAVRMSGGERLSQDVTLYEVDLRELELKAARAEAAAERARRELIEAQTNSLHGPVKGAGTSEEEPKR